VQALSCHVGTLFASEYVFLPYEKDAMPEKTLERAEVGTRRSWRGRSPIFGHAVSTLDF
jgi:hypothetical protein